MIEAATWWATDESTCTPDSVTWSALAGGSLTRAWLSVTPAPPVGNGKQMRVAPHATVGPGSLPLYVTAATLARAADAGAAVGMVLLALATSHLSRPSLVGGVLVACLTAPHLVGPVLARRLDQMPDGRGLLAAAFLLYGMALCGATLSLGRLPVVVTAVLVVVAGLCGPLLTGGLSSRLAGLVRRGERAQRRAQGWDAVTYGIGGSAGPAAVAAVASVTNATVAMLTLAAAAVLAAVVVLTCRARLTRCMVIRPFLWHRHCG